MKKTILILKSRKGDAIFFFFIILFVILTISAIIIEYFRINSMYHQAEYELQRGVNSAVEFAIRDEYRRDGITKMDSVLAEETLWDYFHQNMKLDQEFSKYAGSKLKYRLEIQGITITEEPPCLTLKGWLKTHSIFNFLAGEIKLPFTISSSNNKTN